MVREWPDDPIDMSLLLWGDDVPFEPFVAASISSTAASWACSSDLAGAPRQPIAGASRRRRRGRFRTEPALSA